MDLVSGSGAANINEKTLKTMKVKKVSSVFAV
jgi:hypothetical protein